MRVLFEDETETDWWLYTQGYSEGYEYCLYASKEALQESLQPTPPAEPAFTPMQGQLWEPCEKCGEEPVYLPLHRCKKCWPKPGA